MSETNHPTPAEQLGKSLEDQFKFFTEMSPDERERRQSLIDKMHRLQHEIRGIHREITRQEKEIQERVDL